MIQYMKIYLNKIFNTTFVTVTVMNIEGIYAHLGQCLKAENICYSLTYPDKTQESVAPFIY